MSDSTTADPQYELANEGTLTGLLEEFRKHVLKNMDGMLPATVISYDGNSNLASVQPSVHMVATNGTLVGRAALASIPVLSLGGGGFNIRFPLVNGSTGWIKASDRDISLYIQKSAAAGPGSNRMHSFSDGLFIPDALSSFSLNSEDTNNFVIQSKDGSLRVAIWPDRVKVTSPGGSTEHRADRILHTAEMFQINCGNIQFSTQPKIGALSP